MAQLVSSNKSKGGNKNLSILLDFEWFGVIYQHHLYRGMLSDEAAVRHIGVVIFAWSVPNMNILVRAIHFGKFQKLVG